MANVLLSVTFYSRVICILRIDVILVSGNDPKWRELESNKDGVLLREVLEGIVERV